MSYPVLLFLICVRHKTGPIKLAKTFIAHLTYPSFFMIPGLYSADHLHLTQGSRRGVVLSQAHWATSHQDHMPEKAISEGNLFKDGILV